MPRHPDPDLEKRILDAAWKLWRGGDERLSLRALARAARTNTPAIYRRFKTRREIVRAMLLRLRRDFYEAISVVPTMEEAAAPYLDFALSHPRQYELFFAHQHLLRQWLPGRKTFDRKRILLSSGDWKSSPSNLAARPKTTFRWWRRFGPWCTALRRC